MKNPFYITTAIPYVNAKPHLGFALELVQADVIARYHRLKGEDVFFVTGTDENALKNALTAQAEGISPQELVDRNARAFRNLKKTLNLSWDDFIRTTEPRHIKGAQKFWRATREEDIEERAYSGLYCVGCEEFKTTKDLVDNHCPEHPRVQLETVRERNYFFKLSNYQRKIEELIEKDALRIIPQERKNEVLSFVKQGLQDFSISRSRERAKNWGIPVPGDDTQIQYVWFDALTNYINALGYTDNSEEFEKYWQRNDAIAHVIGKGILRFHAVYWPAMLLSAGLNLPRQIVVHGYLTVRGEKISKSLGNIIDPLEVVRRYGTDALRYWLLREVPTFEDGDFTWEGFQEAYHAHLANGLGNLTARVMKLAEDNLSGPAPEFKAVLHVLHEFEIKKAMDVIWTRIQKLDKRINDEEPFKLVNVDEEKGKALIAELVSELASIARVLAPFLPETSEKILTAVRENRKPETLFPRIA